MGKIIAEYDVGDDGVYLHANGTTLEDIEGVYSFSNTGAGGRHIGEVGGRININGVFDNMLIQNKEIAMGLSTLGGFKEIAQTKE